MTTDKASLSEQVLKWLKESGFPLELEVASTFQDAGFSVTSSEVYVDYESNQKREIDIIATTHSSFKMHHIVQISFHVECKLSGDKPWVAIGQTDCLHQLLPFYMTCSDNLRLRLFEYIGVQSTDSPERSLVNDQLFPTKIGIGIVQAFGKSNVDIAFQAAMSAYKSAAARAIVTDKQVPLEQRPMITYALAFPVVVIDNQLFHYYRDDAGQEVLDTTGVISVRWKFSRDGDMDPLVYLVTRAALPNFVKGAYSTCKMLADTIANDLNSENRNMPDFVEDYPPNTSTAHST